MFAFSAVVIVCHAVGADMVADGVFCIVAFRCTGSRLAALCGSTGLAASTAVLCIRLLINAGMRTDDESLFIAFVAACAINAPFRVGAGIFARTAAIGVTFDVNAGLIA